MQDQWQYFVKQRANNTLPHAMLFMGGEIDFVQNLAKFLLCSNVKQGALEACEKCKSCQLFNAQVHPDYFLVSPEEKSKVITVDQIRQLSHALTHTAQLNYYQIAVIAPAHAMNIAAANALLKTLEEPPGPVIIILISNKPHILPRTIYSRCQVINLSLGISPPIVVENKKLHDLLLSNSYDPVSLAKLCLDFDLELVINTLLNIVMNRIESNLENLPSNQKYFDDYDRLIEIKRLMDNNINFNAQAMLENLFLNVVGTDLLQ